MEKCDIIIPVWNQLDATKNCIDSVIKNTTYPFRLIVVDNASDSETRQYLDGIKDIPCLLIRNEKNIGFVKAVNQGIASADFSYICLLNNDTIVTKSWLEEMVAIASLEKEIGIVNPSSNNLGQRPEKGEPIESFANRLKNDGKGKFVELGAAIGFCMLIKKEVVEKIGTFDEIYGMGNFEDTDFSRRAINEGYRCVRACGAYVYHRESSSFNEVKTFEESFKRNKEIYEFRWGKPKRIAYILDSYDDNILKILQSESIKWARKGDWVWYYAKDQLNIPAHSNLIYETMPPKNFYLNITLKILIKKKKFDQIYVGEEKFGRVLEFFSFIHKAKIKYY